MHIIFPCAVGHMEPPPPPSPPSRRRVRAPCTIRISFFFYGDVISGPVGNQYTTAFSRLVVWSKFIFNFGCHSKDALVMYVRFLLKIV